MAKFISLFNNKGGVGKTTYLYHTAYCLASRGKKVLMVDCDSQCNLTAYTLKDPAIEAAWRPDGNSIYRAIERVARGLGDIYNRAPTQVKECLYIVPGDLLLSDFEDLLGDTWNSARGGAETALRVQSAIYRVIVAAAEKTEADIVLVDLGPNLGALNRAVLGGSEFIIIPVAPDLFSIRGTENLGSKLVTWRREWDQCNTAWTSNAFEIPKGRPKFLGYVIQQHNVRDNREGMTRGWQIFGTRLEGAIQENIVAPLTPLDQIQHNNGGTYNLGRIPNLHSLIPYSLEARKPVFDCTSADGLTGAHITRARESRDHFEPMATAILAALGI
jgi:cellulose biosynthesis protein BcsQ